MGHYFIQQYLGRHLALACHFHWYGCFPYPAYLSYSIPASAQINILVIFSNDSRRQEKTLHPRFSILVSVLEWVWLCSYILHSYYHAQFVWQMLSFSWWLWWAISMFLEATSSWQNTYSNSLPSLCHSQDLRI